MRKVRIPFEEIPIGRMFEFRGAVAVKIDDGSADLIDPNGNGSKPTRKPIAGFTKVVVTGD